MSGRNVKIVEYDIVDLSRNMPGERWADSLGAWTSSKYLYTQVAG